MFRKHLVLALAGLFLALGMNAQNITVKGSVKDSAGDPVIGAGVVIKGTTQGVSTDFPYLMEGAKNAYQTGQKPGCYAQRMNYPNSFKNANPEQYENAMSLMGMSIENTITPLWWAIK